MLTLPALQGDKDQSLQAALSRWLNEYEVSQRLAHASGAGLAGSPQASGPGGVQGAPPSKEDNGRSYLTEIQSDGEGEV
jgi:hypothetical protein